MIPQCCAWASVRRALQCSSSSEWEGSSRPALRWLAGLPQRSLQQRKMRVSHSSTRACCSLLISRLSTQCYTNQLLTGTYCHIPDSSGNLRPHWERRIFHSSPYSESWISITVNQLSDARLSGSRKEIVKLPVTKKVPPVCQKRELGSRKHVLHPGLSKSYLFGLCALFFYFFLQGLGKNKPYSCPVNLLCFLKRLS